MSAFPGDELGAPLPDLPPELLGAPPVPTGPGPIAMGSPDPMMGMSVPGGFPSTDPQALAVAAQDAMFQLMQQDSMMLEAQQMQAQALAADVIDEMMLSMGGAGALAPNPGLGAPVAPPLPPELGLPPELAGDAGVDPALGLAPGALPSVDPLAGGGYL